LGSFVAAKPYKHRTQGISSRGAQGRSGGARGEASELFFILGMNIGSIQSRVFGILVVQVVQDEASARHLLMINNQKLMELPLTLVAAPPARLSAGTTGCSCEVLVTIR
jgi:hypothetical protein